MSNLGPRLGGAAGAQPPLGPHPTPIPAHPQIRCRAFLGPSAFAQPPCPFPLSPRLSTLVETNGLLAVVHFAAPAFYHWW